MITRTNMMDMLVAGGQVERFHMYPCVRRENVAEHSFYVAVLAEHIGRSDFGMDASDLFIVTKLALYHDLPEQVTGDIPGHVKRRVGDFFSEMEDVFKSKWGLHLSPTDDQEIVVAMSDAFAGMLYCLREMRVGNSSLSIVADRYRGYVLHQMERAVGRSLGTACEVLEQLDKLIKEVQK